MGWNVQVASHQNLNCREPLGEHQYEGVPVTVLPPLPGQESRTAVYCCAPDAVPGFEALLRDFRPQIVHFHDFSVGANLLHLRLARAYGARTVMTYHSPGQSCLQRSLLYRGRTVCDGEIRTVRCTECRFSVSGIPATIAQLLAAVPFRTLDPDAQGWVSRVLTARVMTGHFQRAWNEMIAAVDCLQVFSNWSAKLLQLNGVSSAKLRQTHTGAPMSARNMPIPSYVNGKGPLRIAYVGRCDRVKGVHVLIEAVRALPKGVPLEVAFYGPYWDSRYGRKLLAMMAGDYRFLPPVFLPHSEVVSGLKERDICVVPSIWLETGPLVILEAFAAGVPVIGSRLGGIAELVRDGVDGLLFPPGDSTALGRIILTLAQDRQRVLMLKRSICQPRTMADVAHDTAILYEELLAVKQAPPAGVP